MTERESTRASVSIWVRDSIVSNNATSLLLLLVEALAPALVLGAMKVGV